MIGKQTIQDVLKINPTISNDMINAINLWTRMYEDKSPWLHEPTEDDPTDIKSLGLAQTIASEKASMALIEFESEITTPIKDVKPATPNYMNPDNIGTDGKPEPMVAMHVVTEDIPKGSTKRAEYLNRQYIKLKDALPVQLEYAIAKGGLVIKPYLVKKPQNVDMMTGETKQNEIQEEYDIEFDYIQANEFYPLSFNASGKIIEAAFIQRMFDKDTVYSRLEYHKLTDEGVVVINKAFKKKAVSTSSISNEKTLGDEISLTEVEEWASLSPETTIGGVDRLLFAYLKMPDANTIDTHSPLGMSGFAKATKLIKDADIQYSRLMWEFEAGELAIDIDRNALRYLNDPDDPDSGHSVMNKLQNRLYRKVDLNDDNTYNVFSPELRDVSILNGLNTILIKIEDKTGLSRGTLADVNMVSEAKTATELMLQRTRNYQTNQRIQKATQLALEDTIYIMNAYCELYNITEDGEYNVSFEWDDSVLVDKDTELSRRIILMNNGLAGKVETRMWYFGETENQAREALIRIQQENLEAVQQNVEEMQLLGQTPESKKEESPKSYNQANQGSNKDDGFKSGDNQYS